MATDNNEAMRISFRDSVLIMLAIIILVVFCVRKGMNLVIPLFLCWLILWFYTLIRKIPWSKVEKYATSAIRDGFQSILIVMAVGTLIGTWILAGTVPTIIYYGLQIISPSVFLPAAMIISAILSLATGTSYGSAASAGIAMMGIGISMGFPPGMIAGAVISGALFGDKMSPFSDTTNLCPAMAGTTLFRHIGYMMWNTIPAFLISAVVFFFIGRNYTIANFDPSAVNDYLVGLQSLFNIRLFALLPIILVIVLLVLKLDALPTILLGAVSGGIVAMINQGCNVTEVITAMHTGFKVDSGIYLIDRLLNNGGITSMTTVFLIMILGIGLGGMLEKLGVLNNFIDLIIHKITSVGRLVAISTAVGYLTAAIGCTMAISQVLTGKLMAPIFREEGVAPEVLSRAMEDTGTLGTSLIPWSSSCVFFCGALGVTYGEYIPYMFFALLAPIISLIYAYTGFKIRYIRPESGEYVEKAEAPISTKS